KSINFLQDQSFLGQNCRPMKPSELFDLKGETAVVLGGTGALGGAIAQALAEAGAKVAVLGRNAERGQARVKQMLAAGAQAEYFAADALKRDSLESAQQALERVLGNPSILVNAAGGTDPKATVSADLSFHQIQLEAWGANFDLNLVGGVLLPCQVF